MLALLGIGRVWITLGPILVINGVLLVSYLGYHLWGRKRLVHKFEGAKEHSSRLLSSATKDWWLWTTDPIVRLFVRLRMGPNVITSVGFLFTVVAGFLFSQGWFGYAGWFMLFGSSFDMFDGRVARITGQSSRSGAFFDAVMDRFSEGACMLGLAYYFKNSWVLPVVVVALIGSMLVSYTKARAEAMSVACNVGTMQRPERIVYLGVASIFVPIMDMVLVRWWTPPPPVLVIMALVAIATMTVGTAIYRMVYVMNALDTADRRGKESIPQLISKLYTPAGREELWGRARYGYDRSRSSCSHVVLFLIDGVKKDIFDDMLTRGELPNITRHIAGRGGIDEAVSVFPSTTGTASAPFVTGCFPGTCNIPGVRWFDRAIPSNRVLTVNRFRDYLGWGAYVMDHDLSKSVRTIFEYSRQAVNIFGMLNRGCGFVRDPAFFRLHKWFQHVQAGTELDEAHEAALQWFSSAIRRETDFVFYSFPQFGGASVCDAVVDDGMARSEYRKIDQYVGHGAKLLKDRGMYEGTVIMLAGGYGRGEVSGRFDLLGFLARRCRVAPAHRRVRDWQDAEAIMLCSGTSMAHVYIRRDGEWTDKTFFEDIERRGLVGALLEKEGIDILAGRSVDGGILVQTRRGKAHIIEDADGRITYIPKGADPFGFGQIDQVLDSSGAIRATYGSLYPDGILQMLQIFRSQRAGDLVVSASEGTIFIGDDECYAPPFTHGSLRRGHLVVPYLSSRPFSNPMRRTADIFASVMNLLGIEPAHSMDGVLQCANGVSSAAAGVARLS